jgi:uncharacterized membrane protein
MTNPTGARYTYAKAIFAFIVAFLTALYGALHGPGGVTPEEWVYVLLSAVVAGGGVYGLPK